MSVFLGIDTGGTYTDAVLLNNKRGIIATAKALTTRYDLTVGIRNAVQAALPEPMPDIQLVSLSSTLATNAIVEGRGSQICLILVGYEPHMVADARLERLASKKNIILVRGGHGVDGKEQQPLDIKMVREAVSKRASKVAAFAVSGFFGVRNPTHELRIRRLIHRMTGLPVTCGHELTSQLDAPRRAMTVALNARLIPLLQELITSVSRILDEQGINAPLMVVKGDGSLMDAQLALERPVETIMSGPAASVIGALHLCDEKDGFVIDMGGTTTDIAAVHDGRLILNHEGAEVGGWRTMVEAIDMRTTGLGGDSEIHIDGGGSLGIGPRRVIPLSLLVAEYPAALELIQSQMKETPSDDTGRFVTRERPLKPDQDNISPTQQEIWELLGNGPVPVTSLSDRVKTTSYFGYALDGLREHGLVVSSAFTPTDAVHVLGKYRSGSTEAAELGAELWGRRLGISKESFCERVVREVIIQAGYTLIESVLAEDGGLSLKNGDRVVNRLVNRALGAEDGGNLSVTFSVKRPIIGIGAPAVTYLKPLAEKLNTPIFIPEHAEVANAIGAAAGAVVQKVRILIQQPEGKETPYRVYAPSGVRDYEALDDARSYARRTVVRLARKHAHEAGASRIKLQVSEDERIVRVGAELLYLGTEIIATAVGRPKLKERRKQK